MSGPHISRLLRHFNLLVKLTSGLRSSHLNKTTLFRCVNSYHAIHTVYFKRFTRWPTLQPISSLSFHTWTGAFKNRFIQHFHFNFHFQVSSPPTPQLEFCVLSLSFFHLNWQFRSFICYFSFCFLLHHCPTDLTWTIPQNIQQQVHIFSFDQSTSFSHILFMLAWMSHIFWLTWTDDRHITCSLL